MCFASQEVLVDMFRRLMSYSTTSVGQSGQFSLPANATCDSSQVIHSFRYSNVFNHFVFAEIPDSLVTPKEILRLIGSFLTIPPVPPLYSLLGFDERTSKSTTAEFVQVPAVCIVPTFSFEHMDRVLAGPTINNLDRYD